MGSPFSPKVRKIVGDIVEKPKRSLCSPIEICLEDWWLSKPDKGEGIFVSGIPMEIRKCDDAQKISKCASVHRRCASREFHSRQIAKRHGSTVVETCDGFIVLLCGFINKLRTQQNGFSSKVCRDFIYGFPLDWDNYAAYNFNEESKQNNLEHRDGCIPAALNNFNGAELHDLLLSLTDSESDILSDRAYNNLLHILSAEKEDGVDVPAPSSSQPSPLPGYSGKKVTKAGEKRNPNSLEFSCEKVVEPSTCKLSTFCFDDLTTEKIIRKDRKKRLQTEVADGHNLLSMSRDSELSISLYPNPLSNVEIKIDEGMSKSSLFGSDGLISEKKTAKARKESEQIVLALGNDLFSTSKRF